MVRTDFLVIGSGAAGLSFALDVAEVGAVTVVTKKDSAESNTNYAQGGIAVVSSRHDSVETHVQDTLTAGAGLCNEAVVRAIVSEGPKRLAVLEDRGARFARSNSGSLDLGREGGHSENRIVHARDATGREVERTLLDKAREHPNIQLLEHHFAVDIITEHHFSSAADNSENRNGANLTCFGAYILNEHSGMIEATVAHITMLASGGAGQVYLHTTNPAVATGDGLAMGYRARARLKHLEFMQFHPTALYDGQGGSFLISEAVRGEGAILLNSDGDSFMSRYHDLADLAPRDIVARAIDDQMKASGAPHVWLDARSLGSVHIENRFPTIFRHCLEQGIDMRREHVPVVPAAHYMCGGIVTDLEGHTSIRRLLACGEVACTGLHGANRLASNSLLEAIVVSHRAAVTARNSLNRSGPDIHPPDWDDSGTTDPQEWVLVSHNREELNRVMTNYVGIVRSMARLSRAERRTRLLYEETEEFYRKSRLSAPLCELRNLIAVAYLIIKSAKARKESRGLHYMTDFPDTSETAAEGAVLQRSARS